MKQYLHNPKLKFMLWSQICTATSIASPIYLSSPTWLSQYHAQPKGFGEKIHKIHPTTPQHIPNLPLSSRHHSSRSKRSPTTPWDHHLPIITLTMVAHACTVIWSKNSSPTLLYNRTSNQIGLKTMMVARTPSGWWCERIIFNQIDNEDIGALSQKYYAEQQHRNHPYKCLQLRKCCATAQSKWSRVENCS